MATHEDDGKFRSKGKLTLKIEKFSGFAREKPRAERISKTELVQGIEWSVSAQKSVTNPEYMGVYLNCLPESETKSVWSCEATFVFTILARKEEEEEQDLTCTGIDNNALPDSKGSRKRSRNPKFAYKTVKERELHCIFRAKGGGWGLPRFMKFDDLLHPEHGSYDIETDSIIIEAVVKASVPCGVKLNWREQMHTFEKDQGLELYESGDFSDWTIKFVDPMNGENNKEFNVHKYVLATHSDVFRAMFTNKDTQEYKESRVEISDCSQTAIQQMIHFMYTNKMPPDFKSEEASKLLKIADKYNIAHLAVATEKRLIENLAVANVCPYLLLADRHNANSLRIASGKMIRKNLKTVKEREIWPLIRKRYPQLLLDVLEQPSAEDSDNEFQDLAIASDDSD